MLTISPPSPQIIKWVNFTGRATDGACVINDSFGVASVTRRANSCYDIVFSIAYLNADYVVVVTAHSYGSRIMLFGDSTVEVGDVQTTTTISIQCCDWNSTLVDPDKVWLMAIGN